MHTVRSAEVRPAKDGCMHIDLRRGIETRQQGQSWALIASKHGRHINAIDRLQRQHRTKAENGRVDETADNMCRIN